MSSQHQSVSLHVPRYAIWLLAGLLMAPWVAIAIWVIVTPRGRSIEPVAAAAAPREPSASDAIRAKPGPWGDLEYFRILLEPPEEFVLGDYTNAEIRPWVFKGLTRQTIAALWSRAGLTTEQRRFVDDPANRADRTDAIVVQPNREFILGITPAARAILYTALGEDPENFNQYNPFRLRTSAAAEWLDHSDLPADAVALTKRLMYQRGTATCFSDASIVLPTISHAADRVKYVKALSRKSALLVMLKVRPGQPVEPLVEYWGRGGRSKDLKPLLQSLARRPQGGSVDIVHLVPRFARLLAYTYPLPSERPIDANHDCHWTSLNFQNDQPDERFSDISVVQKTLLEQYYPVPGEPTLGDIIMFVRPDGVVVHSCVYIADDIVFTKNGPAFSIPWLFSPLADVQAFYSSTPGIEMRRYRARAR